MTYKRVLLALMRGANRRRKLALDEGEIIGWATHEDGQHYPIHAAQGGGGSSGASGGGNSSGSSGKSSQTGIQRKESTNEEKSQKLVEMGGKKWEKNGMSRVYLNKAGEKMIGLEISGRFGSSGRINGATLNGQKISNTRATELRGLIEKAYYDEKTGQIKIPASYQSRFRAMESERAEIEREMNEKLKGM